jgi:hypothetical protein
MLEPTDVTLIRTLIDDALTAWDATRRERMMAESRQRQEVEHPMVTKLYLISMGGAHIAFPDELGRAIFTQAIYGRVTKREDDNYFHSGKVEVVAFGDGQRLKTPITMVLTGLSIVGMAEVSEELLKAV